MKHNWKWAKSYIKTLKLRAAKNIKVSTNKYESTVMVPHRRVIKLRLVQTA